MFCPVFANYSCKSAACPAPLPRQAVLEVRPPEAASASLARPKPARPSLAARCTAHDRLACRNLRLPAKPAARPWPPRPARLGKASTETAESVGTPPFQQPASDIGQHFCQPNDVPVVCFSQPVPAIPAKAGSCGPQSEFVHLAARGGRSRGIPARQALRWAARRRVRLRLAYSTSSSNPRRRLVSSRRPAAASREIVLVWLRSRHLLFGFRSA